MNTVYGILASLAIMACLAGWGSWESGRVDKLQGQMDSLKASYATAAAQAKLDAQKEENAALDILHAQQVSALASMEKKNEETKSQLEAYQKKVKKASGMKDEGHKCAGVVIPSDLLPGQK